ncbi:MAG: B12-binding domain-containing radical SAM protein [Bacteroidetes bacterium]|nr:B12-binding domain-containing radical SAM protein [Bacteroidota bacterium]
MKKVLFTHSYFLRFDPKQWETGLPYPPLGTLYAAACVREAGYEVNCFDTMFSEQPDEIISRLEHTRPDFFVIYDDGFNYLTKMCLTNMREAAFKMIKLAKKYGCRVIVSSSDSTDHYEQYIQQGADFIILGEAEVTLQELIKSFEFENDDLHSIEGLVFKKEEALVKTAKRNVMKDLDSLPIPAWDLIDIDPYRQSWIRHAGFFSLNMATTRGCPFKCNWCAKPIYGNRYNTRSPKKVVEELKLLKDQFHFEHIWFCDDIFGLKPGWVHEFANLVESENLQFKFKIQCRADLLLQENYIRDLKRAGCDNVWIGAESGSQKILDAMDKGITIDQIQIATGLLKKNKIKPSFFIQFGYPGETKEDIAKTISMINKLLPHEIGISVSYPLPGTVFFESVKNELKQKSNWTDSDELAVMFKNTYSPEFYKRLHRYVHAHFIRVKTMANFKKAIFYPKQMHLSQLIKMIKMPYYFASELLYKQKLKSA